MSRPVAVVTGGTRGIGAATAELLADRGHDLVLGYRSRDAEAAELAEQLGERGVEVRTVRCDVADEADVERLFAVADALGPLAALVNNAGVLEQQRSMVEINMARWRRVFSVNVFGAAACCRAAVRRMSTQTGGKGGAIVNLSSRAAQLGSPLEYVDYAASKAAVDTMTRGLALEVARHGVRVNAVRPGIIDTEIHASGGDPGRVPRLGPAQPMGRPGTAVEVAEAVVWLLSTSASYITGTVLDVSGGR
ncbi:SDR family oxidoreductase [Micromonospora sp. NBC_00389]|uniref:SDR family oxidoreductase n=1 Tax=Micromonospora sp. NBC_00389 TaxID=2903586 RepID=UPI002E1F050F